MRWHFDCSFDQARRFHLAFLVVLKGKKELPRRQQWKPKQLHLHIKDIHVSLSTNMEDLLKISLISSLVNLEYFRVQSSHILNGDFKSRMKSQQHCGNFLVYRHPLLYLTTILNLWFLHLSWHHMTPSWKFYSLQAPSCVSNNNVKFMVYTFVLTSISL